MTTQDILAANVANIFKAADFLMGKELPGITAAASDKQFALASSRRYEAMKMVCIIPAMMREGAAADPAIDAAKAKAAISKFVASWLMPRTAREWIGNTPSIPSLCNEVFAAYQSL